jgi:hypothetical protein
MPITVQELIDDPNRVSELYLEGQHCKNCGVLLQGMLTGKNQGPDGKSTCDDCYYDEIGDEIDKNPICSVR